MFDLGRRGEHDRSKPDQASSSSGSLVLLFSQEKERERPGRVVQANSSRSPFYRREKSERESLLLLQKRGESAQLGLA